MKKCWNHCKCTLGDTEDQPLALRPSLLRGGKTRLRGLVAAAVEGVEAVDSLEAGVKLLSERVLSSLARLYSPLVDLQEHSACLAHHVNEQARRS